MVNTADKGLRLVDISLVAIYFREKSLVGPSQVSRHAAVRTEPGVLALNTSDFFGFRFFGFHFEYGLTTDETYSRRRIIQEQSLKSHTFIIFS